MRSKIFPLAATCTLAIAGCANLPPSLTGQYPSSADAYSRAQAQRVQQVQLGTVLEVRSVTINAGGAEKATGSAIGAAIGGLMGHSVGGGRGKTLATVAGAIAGGIGGNLAAQHAYTQPGLAVTIKLDDGQIVSVTQAADVALHLGERVELTSGYYGQPARVIPAPSEEVVHG